MHVLVERLVENSLIVCSGTVTNSNHDVNDVMAAECQYKEYVSRFLRTRS